MDKRFSYCKFTISEEKQIIDEYKQGNSMAVLGRKWNCDPTTIKNILKAYGESGRTLSEARRLYLGYTINENSFSKIIAPEQSYWLGVMYSDGYITHAQYTNKFGISVAKKDKEWLEKFKSFLNYNGDINTYQVGDSGYKPGAEYVRLLIGNNKIVQDLEHWGVVEHKTKLLHSLPNIPFLDDFIRGYIDGDGSLRKDYPCFQISGNEPFLKDIANYLDVDYRLYPDKTIYSLRYNTKESEYLEKRLYKNAKVYLQRKYNIAVRSFNSPLTLEDVRLKNSEYQGKPLES